MSFDEWFNKNHTGWVEYETMQPAYEAGAQSRQAEIDGLIDMVKTSADSEMYLFDELQKVNKERDELQKRIDEALGVIYSEKSKVECDVYQGVDADLIIGIGYDLHLILKGNKND